MVALPVTGLIANTLSGGPVALADVPGTEAPVRVLPSEDLPARTPGPSPSAAQGGRTPTAVDKRARAADPTDPADPEAGRSPWRGKIPDRGSGRFRTADVSGPVVGEGGRLLRYSVRVERELPFDADVVARQVQQTLSDERSWTGSGQWRLQLVPQGKRTDFSVLVATPKTTDAYCLPLFTWGRLSCQDGPRAVLNARRWAFGASAYGDDVAGYRLYLINHEVGHVLGFGHRLCPKKGARAPVMVQQTKGLQGCRPNPWPSPRR